MSKSVVNIIDFPVLYNVLFEVKEFLNFEVVNHESINVFLEKIQKDSSTKNSIIVTKNFLNHKDINQKSIIHLDNKPINFLSLIDRVNTNLLKQKYSFQSSINIKDYTLNLNSRVISQKKKALKLTEREIDIILFLKDQKKPQNINILQKEVWSYAENLETHTVETHVYRLRKKISDTFKDENFIISLKEGYSI
ncbi:MAG: response regulator transcription factor [Pelagibacterales bacterium]|nr:response regulator transcription factor [Pelagibacterales bacterium]